MATPSTRVPSPGRRSSTSSASCSPTAAGWTGTSTTSMAPRSRARPTGATSSRSLMMTKFKELADVCHPDNLANGTLELNTVYQSGNIAMQTQYHEFAASIEDEKTSRAAGGKTAYAPCPKGDPDVDQERRRSGERHQLRHRRHRHQRQCLRRPEARGLHLRDLVGVAGEPVQRSQGPRRHADPQVGAGDRGGEEGQAASDHHAERADLRRRLRLRHQGPALRAGPEDPERQRVSLDPRGRSAEVPVERAVCRKRPASRSRRSSTS